MKEGHTLLTVNIESEIKEALKEMALADRRTLSNFVVTELARLVAQKKSDRDRTIDNGVTDLEQRANQLEKDLQRINARRSENAPR